MVTLQNGEKIDIPEPADPARHFQDIKNEKGDVVKSARDQVPCMEEKKFKDEITNYVKRKKDLQKNMEIAFAIIQGQCSYDLQQKMENNADWDRIYTNQDVLDLLEMIKITTYKFEDEKYLPLFIHNAKSVYYRFNQGNLSLNDYREKFMNIVEVATSYKNKLHDEAVSKQVCKDDHGH